jgi:hypothetical protein
MDSPDADPPVKYGDITAAARILRGVAVRTPLLENKALNPHFPDELVNRCPEMEIML